MFEIGFSELVMVGLVALLVIGPERLPKFARLAGFWIGKTRSMVANVKSEIQQELHAEEIRQTLKDQANLRDLERLYDETSDAIYGIKSSLEQLPEESVAQIKLPHEPE